MDVLTATALILAAAVLLPAALLIFQGHVRKARARKAGLQAMAAAEAAMTARREAAEQLVRDINQRVMPIERMRAHYAISIPHPDNQPIVTKGWMQP